MNRCGKPGHDQIKFGDTCVWCILVDNPDVARNLRGEDVTSEKHFQGRGFESVYYRILMALRDHPEYTGSARGKKMREILNLSFELDDPRDRMVWNSKRQADYEFAMRMFIWILNGGDDYMHLVELSPVVSRFCQNDRGDSDLARFSAAYGPRIVRQLPPVLSELKRDPGTRRAVISVRLEDDLTLLGTDSDVEYPCTNDLQFFRREARDTDRNWGQVLDMQVNMRSNNMATTLVYDVFNFTMLQEYVARWLSFETGNFVALGRYMHHAASAHYFEEQQPLVDALLADSPGTPFFQRRDRAKQKD